MGTIKHAGHGAKIDVKGKDTYRHSEAGAVEVCIVSSSQLAVFRKPGEEMTAEQLVAWYFAEVDLVLAEGFKGENMPKIEVLKEGGGGAKFKEDDNLIAVVCDGEVDAGAPVFRRNETGRLADLIVEKFPASRLKNDVRLRVDGKTIPVKPFVKAFIGNTVKGMIASLKGCKKPERVDLRIGK